MKKGLIGTLIAASLVVAACGQRPAPAATPPAAPATSVGVAPAVQTDLRQALTYNGDVKSVAEVQILPKSSGRIEKLPVDVGSTLKVGDVIAQIEHTSQDLALQEAKSQLQTAQARLDTIKAGPRAETVM